MFTSIADICCGAVDRNIGPKHTGLKPIYWYALAADIILGVALLIIGVLATQFGFLSSNVQYAFIGAGAAYSIGMLCYVGAVIKAGKSYANSTEK